MTSPPELAPVPSSDLSWKPMRVQRRVHPLSPESVFVSLREVAKRASAGRLDPDVRRWAINTIAENGRPTEAVDVARTLLDAVRRDYAYVLDPTHSEYMVAPGLLARGVFKGGDCDDLTIFLASLIMSACSSAGLRCAIVGHGYPHIQHVLMAVHDGRKWWYADPTGKEPFGDFDVRPGREVVYDIPVPEGAEPEPFCDAEVCLHGRYQVPPPVIEHDGAFVGVAGPPKVPGRTPFAKAVLGSASREPPPPARTLREAIGLGCGCRQQDLVLEELFTSGAPEDEKAASLLEQLSPVYVEQISQVRDGLLEARASLEKTHQKMVDTGKSLGIEIPMVGPPQAGLTSQWTVREEGAYEELLRSIDFAVKVLSEVLEGKRPAGIVKDSDDIGFALLPGEVKQLKDAAVGQIEQWWSAVPTVSAPPASPNFGLGIGPVAVIVWVGGGLVAAAGIAATLMLCSKADAIARACEYIMQKFTQWMLVREQRLLVEKGASPEEARKAVDVAKDAIVESDRSYTERLRAEPKGYSGLALGAALVLGVAAGVGGARLAEKMKG